MGRMEGDVGLWIGQGCHVMGCPRVWNSAMSSSHNMGSGQGEASALPQRIIS